MKNSQTRRDWLRNAASVDGDQRVACAGSANAADSKVAWDDSIEKGLQVAQSDAVGSRGRWNTDQLSHGDGIARSDRADRKRQYDHPRTLCEANCSSDGLPH